MRFAARALWRRPAFTLTAALTVALGIGANTALFGVVYSVLIRPLPFRDPGALAQIWETHPALPQLQVAAPDFADWRAQAHSFEQLAAHTLSAMNTAALLGQGEPAIVHATMASANLFPLMGISPLGGRAFTAAEEAAKARVALLSEGLWRTKFGADPAAVGREIRLGGDSFRVVGIVPARQAFPEWADLWIPLSLMDAEMQTRRKYHPLEVIGRLKRGVSAGQAQTEIAAIAQRLAREYPETNATIGAYVIPLERAMTREARPSLLLAWAAVGLVLLIACANLAHLFLARFVERRGELAIRRALGAGAWNLTGQLLSESLLLAALGGALGVALAVAAGKLLRGLAASEIPRIEWMRFEPMVWLFAIAISAAAAGLVALPACLRLIGQRGRFLENARTVTRAHSRLSSILLAGQVALALLALSGTALLARSFRALLDQEPGFQTQNVWEIPNLPLREDWNRSAEFLTARLAPGLRNVAGVTEVAAVNSAPMSLGASGHSRFATRFGIEGRRFDSGGYPVAQNRWITPDYFRTLGIPLERGRWLTEADRNQPRILVNQTLARRFFAHGDAVGKRLALGVMDARQTYDEIVGVVGDVRDFGLDQEAEPTMYGVAAGPVMTLLVKTANHGNGVAQALRDAIHRVDANIPVTGVQPLAQNVAESLARRRFALTLLAIFAGMAALLTAGGIYGLLTQSVNARVREFGVRMAVGATPMELARIMLRKAITLAAPGLIAGAGLALGFARAMKSFVYRVSPADPASIAAAAGLLLVVVALSAWLPARRAAASDPAMALRQE